MLNRPIKTIFSIISMFAASYCCHQFPIPNSWLKSYIQTVYMGPLQASILSCDGHSVTIMSTEWKWNRPISELGIKHSLVLFGWHIFHMCRGDLIVSKEMDACCFSENTLLPKWGETFLIWLVKWLKWICTWILTQFKSAPCRACSTWSKVYSLTWHILKN